MTKSGKLLITHYYNGASRIASRIGGGFQSHADLNYDPLYDHVPLASGNDYNEKSQTLIAAWTRNASCAGLNEQMEFSYSMEVDYQFTNPGTDGERYFYHSDHLGSSAFITSENGYATQFLAYLPFGEVLAEEQNSTSYYSPFTFSAKEKDPETGYSYFGARYYSPELSVWLSVDPMSDERPSLSPYNYCQWNPVMLVDPTGMLDEDLASMGRVSEKYQENLNAEVQVLEDINTNFPTHFHHIGNNGNGDEEKPKPQTKLPTREMGGFIEDKEAFLKFMKEQAIHNEVEVAAWELVNPNGGENIFFVQPWWNNKVDESRNNPAPGFEQASSYVRQYHTHPHSNRPGFTDASQSSRLGIPVITIGADGRTWEVTYPKNYAVPRGILYGKEILIN